MDISLPNNFSDIFTELIKWDPPTELMLSSVRGNHSISTVHKNENNPQKVYILIKYNHCVMLSHPLASLG